MQTFFNARLPPLVCNNYAKQICTVGTCCVAEKTGAMSMNRQLCFKCEQTTPIW